MHRNYGTFPALLLLLFVACGEQEERSDSTETTKGADTLLLEGEINYLSNLRQLTFGGENAEGYFSFDERTFVFQRTRPEEGDSCDQIYTYDLESGEINRVSNGEGRTTCAYYLPGDSLILYASTHQSMTSCPPTPDYSQGYVWPILP